MAIKTRIQDDPALPPYYATDNGTVFRQPHKNQMGFKLCEVDEWVIDRARAASIIAEALNQWEAKQEAQVQNG